MKSLFFASLLCLKFSICSTINFDGLSLRSGAEAAVEALKSIPNLGWEAGINNRFTGEGLLNAKTLMGVRKTNFTLPLKVQKPMVGVPDSWDSRTQFPQCPSISDIWDQSACGSCYVLATVMSASDRMCVATNGSRTERISAEEMLSCCHTCGNGCADGFPPYAWAWMASHGSVTGGSFGDNHYCSAYSLPQCEHYSNGSFPACGAPFHTPKCVTACDKNSTYPVPFGKDTIKFVSSYQVASDDTSIMQEIVQHGSVTATFNVYSDFLHYKSGVYQAMGGDELGGHAVRIIGYGTEDSKPYWLVANSWNKDWGDNGYFKILRGNCGINLGVYGGKYR